jgi:hypothetical protein
MRFQGICLPICSTSALFHARLLRSSERCVCHSCTDNGIALLQHEPFKTVLPNSLLSPPDVPSADRAAPVQPARRHREVLPGTKDCAGSIRPADTWVQDLGSSSSEGKETPAGSRCNAS